MESKKLNSIYDTCVNAMLNNTDLTKETAIRQAMMIFGVAIEDQKDTFDILFHKLTVFFDTSQEQAHFLDVEQEFTPWIDTVESDKYYSERYYDYLKNEEQLPAKIINVMKSTNVDILERLGNPNIDKPFKRQGLVVGNVQSGKTANYLSLINLAADYGYKLIILITGVHNNLRSQTQKRVNRGFIGYDSESQTPVGVGVTHDPEIRKQINSKLPHCLTNLTDDFNERTRVTTAVRLENARNPVIMVIKKNHKTLNTLITWLRNKEEGQRFIDQPALIIDDEADNASINTKKEPNKTTTINGQIREVFNLFRQGSYIGYTATPFANIFIDPNTHDEALDHDLFPKHFIFTLVPPSNYLGATQFFLDENGDPNYNSPYIEFIDDNEDTIPFKKPKDLVITELPKSLTESVYEYLVSIVIKGLRPGTNKHTSMLVNISHRTQAQTDVRDLLSQELEEIRLAVKYHGSKTHLERIKNNHLRGLHHKFLPHSDECSDDEFFTKLQKVIDTVKVRVINSESKDKLDYDNYDNGLNVIAIGGYALSRGFTLEGLTVSYLIRNTAMADTLLQMGRWFGYRDQYSDLCKLYIPNASFEWYAFIAQSMEELRNEFIIMEQSGLTPAEFGLKVRTSNTGILITARNKMHHTEELKLSESFSEEAFTLRGIALDNLFKQREVFNSFAWDAAGKYGYRPVYNHVKSEDDKQFYLIQNVSMDEVINLIRSYQHSIDDIERKEALITYIEERSDELANWDVAIHKSYLGEEAAHQVRTFAQSCYQSDHVKTADGGGRILRPWEEAFGLTEEQYQRSEQQKNTSKVKQTARFYRRNRVRPLIVLKCFDLKKNNQDANGKKKPLIVEEGVPAYAISFPKSSNHNPVNYVVNKVFMEDYFGDDDGSDELGEDDE